MFDRKLALPILLITAFLAAEAGPLRMGDHLMDRGEYLEALAEYRDAESNDPNNPEIMWRIGAALTRLSSQMKGSARHDSLEVATNYLIKAIAADQSIVEAHIEYARALGTLALFKPDWDDVRVARRVREELLLVLDEQSDNPDALYLMGLWHKWVCPKPLLMRKPNDLGAACIDSSAYYLRRAVKKNKENLEFQLELGLLYLSMEQEGAAKEVLIDITKTKDVPNKYLEMVEQAKLLIYNLENPGAQNPGDNGQ